MHLKIFYLFTLASLTFSLPALARGGKSTKKIKRKKSQQISLSLGLNYSSNLGQVSAPLPDEQRVPVLEATAKTRFRKKLGPFITLAIPQVNFEYAPGVSEKNRKMFFNNTLVALARPSKNQLFTITSSQGHLSIITVDGFNNPVRNRLNYANLGVGIDLRMGAFAQQVKGEFTFQDFLTPAQAFFPEEGDNIKGKVFLQSALYFEKKSYLALSLEGSRQVYREQQAIFRNGAPQSGERLTQDYFKAAITPVFKHYYKGYQLDFRPTLGQHLSIDQAQGGGSYQGPRYELKMQLSHKKWSLALKTSLEEQRFRYQLANSGSDIKLFNEKVKFDTKAVIKNILSTKNSVYLQHKVTDIKSNRALLDFTENRFGFGLDIVI